MFEEESWGSSVQDSPADIIWKRENPAIAEREELLRKVNTARWDALSHLEKRDWVDCTVIDYVATHRLRRSALTAHYYTTHVPRQEAAVALLEVVVTTRFRKVKKKTLFLTSGHEFVVGKDVVELESFSNDMLHNIHDELVKSAR